MTTDLAALGVTAHPGYADELEGIRTPAEAAASALELAARLQQLALLESRPRTNAIALLEHHQEAGTIVEQLRAFLLCFEVPA